MQMRRITFVAFLLLVCGIAAPAAESPSSYAKKATWAETMLASRANYLRWCQTAGEEPGSPDVKASKAAQQQLAAVWRNLTADFPGETRTWQRGLPQRRYLVWFRSAKDVELERKAIEDRLAKLGLYQGPFRKRFNQLQQTAPPADDPGWLNLCQAVLSFSEKDRKTLSPMERIDTALMIMGDSKYRKQRDQLVAAKVAENDPRVLDLAAKIEQAYGTFRKNVAKIKSMQKQLDKLGPRAGEIRKRFDELRAAGTPPGDRRWLKMKSEIDGIYQSYAVAEARIKRTAQWLAELGPRGEPLRKQYDAVKRTGADPFDAAWKPVLAKADELYERFIVPRRQIDSVDFAAVRRAIRDLTESFPQRYTRGDEYLEQLDQFERRLPAIRAGIQAGETSAFDRSRKLLELCRDALLSNPLLDFDKLLLVKRAAVGKMGLPQNWQGNCALAKTGYDNEIAVLSPVRGGSKLTTLYRPEAGSRFVGDVDLNFDADKLLFSMPGTNDNWQIHEIGVDGRGLRQVTPGDCEGVNNYDPCYLSDGRIIFDSTRCFHGVPCVGGNNTVANLFSMNADGTGIRQLCFDQDHDWCPVVLNNGRILYSRWEYSDAPHYFTRLLFHMNPDGTNQMEYYGSNSPWPNSMFYARPIPGHPTKVVAVISGHHGVPRMGELLVFDPALGRQQADGAVQRIPGYGKKVEPVIGDRIVNESWPRFLHPYPLNDKYFLVSCQPDADSLWGIYLVDTFDNATLIHQQPGYAMLEPVPLRKTSRPPVLPDQVDLESRTALVYLSDVYAGKGLDGVPRGTVKRLRIYEQHYAYPKMGGHHTIGIDGPWDVKRILGTVPVKEDGSANFLVPANTPLAVQPLDDNGRALQLMRSWFTAMPGEIVSCVGCHDSQNTTPAAKHAVAMRGKPSEIVPWYGPARGFSFKREVQPVLDEYCVGCHDGTKDDRPNFSAAGQQTLVGKKAHRFTPSYVTLHPYVRRPGPESDYFMQKPLEFHAGTSELIQMLEKGHHNVKLDDEAWDRLVTWIDLNVPDHGTWGEYREIAEDYGRRRLEMRARYANRPEDPEEIVEDAPGRVEFVKPEPLVRRKPADIEVAGWPFDAEQARQRQASVGVPVRATMKLDDEVELAFSLVPPGRFVIGSEEGGFADERPRGEVAVENPFYLGTCEITNRQYAAFDPVHDSAYISMTSKDHSRRGHPVNGPDQPVVRVTWQQAEAFCRWLSARTGKRFRLPTEAEWEWACRAGTDTPFGFGTGETDFGSFANLADQTLKQFASRDSPKWHPRDDRFNDGAMVTADVGGYQPNAWGLSDMHGNAAEWTASVYRPYAYDPADGRESTQAEGTRTVRGGSWYDRPARATSSFRLPYQPWQRVYNVGFRVVMEVQ